MEPFCLISLSLNQSDPIFFHLKLINKNGIKPTWLNIKSGKKEKWKKYALKNKDFQQ